MSDCLFGVSPVNYPDPDPDSPGVQILLQFLFPLFSQSLFRPQAEYATTVWSPFTKQNVQRIEIGQRRAAQRVSNRYSSYDSVSAMLSNLCRRSRQYRRYDSHLMIFYKIQYGLVAVPVPVYFECPTRNT